MKLLLFITCFLLISVFVNAQNQEIIFEQISWKQITQKAKNEDKIIFLDAYTDWCRPCKVMDKEVFTNDEVAGFYNQNFINVKLDMEKGIGVSLAKKYGIKAYPTLFFLDSEGDIIHVFTGERDVSNFIKLGKEALQPKKKLELFKKKFVNGNRNYEFMTNYLNLMNDLEISTDSLLTIYFDSQKSDSLLSKNNWSIINKYLYHTNNKAFLALTQQKNKFIRLYTTESVEQTIFNLCRREMFYIAFVDSIKSDAYLSLRGKIIKYCIPEQKEGFLYMTDKVYYSNKKDWFNYAKITSLFADKYDINQDKVLNEISWNFYVNIEDEKLLKKAQIWIEKAISLKELPSYYDTYAHILFKLGNKNEAIVTQEKAIALAKKNNEDTSLLEEELAKLKQ